MRALHHFRNPAVRKPNRRLIAVVCLLLTAAPFIDVAQAGKLRLRSGFELTGEPIKRTAINLDLARTRGTRDNAIYPLMTVEDGVRRYFFPYRQTDRDSVEEGSDIGLERFEFDQPSRNRSAEPNDMGGIDHSIPFAARGTRNITVQTDRGPLEISQGVLEVRPDYVEVVSLDIAWDYGLLTDELSDESLMSLLDAATNPLALQDVLSRVGFLIKANRLHLARNEMEKLTTNFPDQQARVDAFNGDLDNLYGLKALGVVKRLKSAGQHAAVMRLARTIRDSGRVSASTSDQADEILFEYEQLVEKRDDVLFQLDQLEGELEEFDAAKVRPLRPMFVEELHVDTINRLEPFFRSIDDSTLTASEKLAIAYSAWVTGADNATTNLDDAVDSWTLRAAVLDCVRADNRYLRDQRFAAVEVIEGVDITDLQEMIPLLPAIDPPADLTTNGPLQLQTRSGVDYLVTLPPEYSPHRSYPVLIVLHDRGLQPEHELVWWSGSAARPDLGRKRGYIVAAPTYLADGANQPGGDTHDRLADVLVDMRRRFRIDSDRAFLAGHGRGADVVWDAGLARPTLWAGLVPIGGLCSPAVKASWENGNYTQIYAVNGGLDARTFRPNAATLQRMMEAKHNLMLCEYKSRGRESYAAEKPRIFDWLALQQRRPLPTEIDATIFHQADTDWTWYRPAARGDLRVPDPGERPVGQKLKATVTLGNMLYLGSQAATVMLSPRMVDYDKRVRFKYGSRLLKTRLMEPSMQTMLNDFATRFDRECLFWNELSVP